MNFWKGKKVLVTGHTGFKGTWLTILLNQLEADLVGISLPDYVEYPFYNTIRPNVKIREFFCDLRHTVPSELDTDFDIIFHMAAQAIVSEGHRDPYLTYSTNILSMVNMLQFFSAQQTPNGVFVNVTSDKCYLNVESNIPYTEDQKLGGLDHYSASKACCELINSCYQNQFRGNASTSLISVRAGNVIGGGDWSKDRLIPDIMNHFFNGTNISFRDKSAVRPWQHVLEPLHAYLKIAEDAFNRPGSVFESYNVGPLSDNFRNVSTIIDACEELHGSRVTAEKQGTSFYETNILKLDVSKLIATGIWKPKWDFINTIRKTYCWYENYASGSSAFELCIADIKSYGEENEL